MGLKVYNALTNTIEEFIPRKGRVVNLYVCGPTVYNYIHIGNARPVVFFDMFKRYLTHLGYDVNYTTNITDVDDKIINKAIESNVSESEISTKYANAFLENVKELNCLDFDNIPYATKYIDQMGEYINRLIKEGYAYVVDGDVYFRVHKFSDYGKLSNQKVEELNNGVRINVNPNKETQVDFSLWKKTDKGIKFKTNFSEGRPGWHTECVCMIDEIYKDGLDVHGGGFDLKFPHHENEIAQYEVLHDNDFSKYFIHVGRLDLNGEKMSKSTGNMILVNDLREDNSFMAYKLLILMHNYRNPINFSNDLFDEYKKGYTKILTAYKQANIQLDLNNINNSEYNKEYFSEFINYMNDDFNTPNVYTLILNITKDINQYTRSKDYNKLVIVVNTLNIIFDLLGIELPYKKMTSSNIEVYKNWEKSRVDKDFEKADFYRSQLISEDIL